jgi:glycosyltransferase involved in cell wall biosynthesis
MSTNAPIRVTHYHRKAYGSFFSIERVFSAIRSALPNNIACTPVVCRFRSRGLFRRLWNAVEAAFRQGQVNHITGDVHYLAAFLHRRRTAITIHDCVSMRGEQSGLRHRVFRWVWYQMPMARASVIVAISEFTRRQLRELVPACTTPIIVIPDPVAVGFLPSPKPFNAEEPVILHLGTTPHKNIERVAEALQGIPCSLDIVGDLNQGQKHALELFGIKYSTSSRLTDAEIIEKYRAADIVEFCSTYEGFGMPVVEGNAMGRPVVTSCIEPMAWVAGSAACLIDPYDITSIRAGILRVIEDHEYRNELVRLGFENAKRFSPDTVAQAYSEVYQRLAAGGGQTWPQ